MGTDKLKSDHSPQRSIEDLELADIIDSQAIQSLMDDFYRVARIPMSIIDLKGKVLVGVGWQDICVRFHRSHSETCKHCLESDIRLSAGIPRGELKLYKCLNNMWDHATPLFVCGKHMGNVISGQFFFDDEPIDYDLFRSQARKYGFDENEYIGALESVPRLSRSHVKAGMSFFIKIADVISSASYDNINLAQSLAERDALMVSLRESREDLNRAQAVAQTGSWRLDVRQNELTWSDETYRIFGIPGGTPLTYEKFLGFVHPEDREYVDRKWSAAMRGEPYDIEHRIIVDDTLKWVRERAELEFDEEGSLQGGFGTVQDITERKRAEDALRESAERHRSIFENSMDGIILSQPHGRILAANPEACRMHGYTEAEMRRLGRDGITDRSDPELPKMLDARSRTGRYQGEVTHVRRDGTRFPCEESSAVFKDKLGQEASVVIIRDVTERRRAEEALRKAHDELELRVRERTAELERKNQELREFAFVASHDLNEPLRKIQTFGSLLKEGNAVRLSEQETDYISRMTGAADRMRDLLDALLRYSRVDTIVEEFRPLRLDDIVRDAATDLEVTIQNIKAHLEIGPLPIVMGDPHQLRQLFQNLIANSLKYHRSEVKPLVRVYGEEKKGACRIFVEDSGIGFDEKYLEKIFQPFQRLHGKEKYPGTGIGLAICRKIVDRHGGTITAKSTPGKGSTFIITLPVDATKTIGNRSEGYR